MLKIGHRGASAYAPENTLAAFRKALELGADGIELDVHRCASGEPVVIHDDTVDRTTSGHGSVVQMTLTQLQALGIPTLEEVMQVLGKEAYYFIEIKATSAALPVAAVVERFIKQGFAKERLMMISFLHVALKEVRKDFPALAVGASFERLDAQSVSETVRLSAQAILPQYSALTREHIRQAHDAGLKVITWTVNDSADIARLMVMGVDGIISDYPDRLHV
jgi:glycerophosphoryl diester phosphodiesterase